MRVATITQPIARNQRAIISKNQPSFRAIARPLIDIVVPVLNEEKILRRSITTLDEYMAKHLPYRYQITIMDNGSQDKTLEIAKSLAEKHQSVRVVSLAERGRGRALKQVWQNSPADILTYMDVDLSTSLDDFLPMIQPLVAGEAGVAIGSRLMKDSRTSRGVKREFISRCYNKIIKWTLGTKFSDAQCGFKVIRRDVAAKFLPKIKDNEWFFDTELLIKTERAGVPIHEQPVTWIEDTDSRVKIVKTAVDDLKGLYRVNKELDKRSWLEKWTLPALLVLTGALYLFGALHNGMANSYYAAAVQAASQDWTAWLFGSLDAANYVSVDKPPLATMVMGLSARLFGFSSFSMLLPSVLAGVGSVWLVYAAVKQQFGFMSAAIAGSVLAFTPVAALVGISLPFLWGAYVRRKPYAWLLPVLVGVTAVTTVIILGYAGMMIWLMWIVGLLGLAGMIGLLISLYAPQRWLQNSAIVAAIVACMLAPTVYTLATVNVAHTGSIPTAGSSSTAMQGSNNEKSQADSQLVQYLLRHQHGATWLVAVASVNESAAIQLTSGQPVMAAARAAGIMKSRHGSNRLAPAPSLIMKVAT